MKSSKWLTLAAAMLGISASGGAAAPPEAAEGKAALEAERIGQLAPADAWPVEGGCSAHTGETRARPLRGPLVVAWKFEVQGEIDEEPRVWREKCYVSEWTSDDRHVLHVLGSGDGVERYKQSFDIGTGPLSVAVGARELVLNGRDGLEGWAVGERMLTKRWASKSGDRTFVRRGDVVWVVGKQGIERYGAIRGPGREPDPTSSWSAESKIQLAPAIAVRGDMVYVVGQDDLGNASVYFLSATTFDRRTIMFVGNHDVSAMANAKIVVGPEDLFIQAMAPLKTHGGKPANTVWVRLAPSGMPAEDPSLVDMPSLPACPRSGFLGAWQGPEGARELVHDSGKNDADGKRRYGLLASSTDRAEYVNIGVQPTTTGSVVYLGGRCFDTQTREVLREDALPSTHRVVPVRDLLLVTSGKRVTAYREDRGSAAPSALPLKVPSDAASGVFPLEGVALALADGSARTGSFSVDLPGRTLSPITKSGDKGKIRLETVLAIATATEPRRLLFARDTSSAVEGLDAIVERAASKEWLAGARELLGAGAPAEARDLLAEAAIRGADEAECDKLRKDLDAPPTPNKRLDAKRRDAVQAKVVALRARALAQLWTAAQQLPADASFALRTGLIQEVLRRDPKHTGASAWVRSEIPAGIPVSEPFEAEEWLRFVEAVHRAPVTLVAKPEKGEKDLSHQKRQLGSALFTWRPDLIGIESGPLLVLTSVNRPTRIAKCLSTGRQVCDYLETLFAGGAVKRDARYPLTHELYETKDEYLRMSTKTSGGLREEAMRALEMTAGHFDPDANVSRMFLPPADREFSEVVSTYAHELTHHWMSERCPRFNDAERDAGGGRGYWVVEGIAECTAELEFDLVGVSPPTLDPRGRSLDLVAHAADADLNPWGAMFEWGTREFNALPTKSTIKIPMRWKLGWHRKESPMNLFYAQASATSSYLLFAEGGRHKESYLAYVTDHYKGLIQPGAMLARFGMSPDELGKRVVAWCRERVNQPDGVR